MSCHVYKMTWTEIVKILNKAGLDWELPTLLTLLGQKASHSHDNFALVMANLEQITIIERITTVNLKKAINLSQNKTIF